MTRHIRLPLGSTTTETHCGNCEHVAYARSVWLIDGLCYQASECRLTGESLQPGPAPIRTDDCRAAEIKDEDKGAIIRLLAMLVRAPTDDDGRPEIECSRETLVAMAMAARRELDAMRDKIKYEEV